MSIENFEREMPEVLRWNPHWIADPIPEWWLREVGLDVQRQILAIRLETVQAVLTAQAEGFGRAAALVNKAQ
jgi:hypothetical protein